MKLDRLVSGALAAAAVALACGCSTAHTMPAPRTTASAPAPSAIGMTRLMSAEMSGPAPKVGKAHLAVDAVDESGADDGADAPKEARGSDGSRRGGGFGSSK